MCAVPEAAGKPEEGGAEKTAGMAALLFAGLFSLARFSESHRRLMTGLG